MKKNIEKLKETMKILRSEKGCPWDKKQTISSLKPYIIEEAFEVVEAIDNLDNSKESLDELKKELGDLLLQVVFISQMASEQNLFDFEDVADAINTKLIVRHPHVFGDETVKDADEVLKNWNQIKKDKENKKRLLDGIPQSMPSILLAQRYAERAATVGFDWENVEGPLEKLQEEISELKEAISLGDKKHIFDETGDVLCASVNVARKLEIRADDALKECAKRFKNRFDTMEELNPEVTNSTMTLEEMENLWQKAKQKIAEKKENE